MRGKYFILQNKEVVADILSDTAQIYTDLSLEIC